MPLTWDAGLYSRAYRIPVFDGAGGVAWRGYERQVLHEPSSEYRERVIMLAQLGMGHPERILVVGCGFGWLVESLRDAWFSAVWGVDSSPHIHANKTDHARDPDLLIQGDVREPGCARSLADRTGGPGFDWVVTEAVAESYKVGELPDLYDACERLLRPGLPAARVVHMVNVAMDGADPIFTWLSFPAWKATCPAHTFLGLNGDRRGQVIEG